MRINRSSAPGTDNIRKTSLDVHLFLTDFRRFASRRGLPVLLLSDNAKTFKGAYKDMCKLS